MFISMRHLNWSMHFQSLIEDPSKKYHHLICVSNFLGGIQESFSFLRAYICLRTKLEYCPFKHNMKTNNLKFEFYNRPQEFQLCYKNRAGYKLVYDI